jgi:DNA repair protein RadD
MNSTIIRQNAETYKDQGGNAGIFCASLGMKQTTQPIIFASPLSVRISIKKSGKLSKVPFNLIVVDECHNINVKDTNTSYMRIFNHYTYLSQLLGHKLRFVGLTGTPFRGKGYTIVGDDLFFKEEVCAITAEWLIENNYLAPAVWGVIDKTIQYDFQQLKVNSLGKFKAQELEDAINKSPRLTGKIMTEVQEVVKNRKGAFIFASSIKHCQECAEWLPEAETAIITGDTPHNLREAYITKARAGVIKYLVNVNVLCTGVDVPSFDTIVFVRPTESLVLYVQCVGRGLRLSDGKESCLIMDYAGNLERHGDIDNPLINKALRARITDDPEHCIECFNCNTLNTLMARRCIGVKDDARCDHWFDFRACENCGAKNDIVARECWSCKSELIDPNKKLKKKASTRERTEFDVIETHYLLSVHNEHPVFIIKYQVSKFAMIQERFYLIGEKSRNFFYHVVAKKHFASMDGVYENLDNLYFLKNIIENNNLNSPYKIECVYNNDAFKVVKKYFTPNQAPRDLQ